MERGLAFWRDSTHLHRQWQSFSIHTCCVERGPPLLLDDAAPADVTRGTVVCVRCRVTRSIHHYGQAATLFAPTSSSTTQVKKEKKKKRQELYYYYCSADTCPLVSTPKCRQRDRRATRSESLRQTAQCPDVYPAAAQGPHGQNI